jgi:hypothetical protein
MFSAAWGHGMICMLHDEHMTAAFEAKNNM